MLKRKSTRRKMRALIITGLLFLLLSQALTIFAADDNLQGLSFDARAEKATENSAYILEINNEEDAISFQISASEDPSHYEGKTVRLNADISLTKPWVPITAFSGVFDGQNHTISGLNIVRDTSNGYNAGFFSLLTLSGVVKNLNLSGTIEFDGSVGSIAALNKGTITNCSFSGTIVSNDLQLIAADTASACGGIVGINNGLVDSCSVVGKDSVITRDGLFCGGIVGMSYANASNLGIYNCTNEAAVNSVLTEEKTKGGVTGGIVGLSTVDGLDATGFENISAQIVNCINKGNISSDNGLTGGIAGQLYNGKIENCTNEGNITQSKLLWTGGIVGSYNQTVACNEGSESSIYIKNCTNKGSIDGYTRVGGIVGGDENNSSHDLYRYPSVLFIEGCVNTGDLTAKGYVGGIDGYSRSAIKKCYNLGNITNTLLDDSPKSYNAAGGIASRTGMQIIDCFNLGNITTVTSDSLSYIRYSGGILGIADVDSPIIIRSYSSGSVTGNCDNLVYYGGILGAGRPTALSNTAFNKDLGGKAQRAIGSYVGEDSDMGLTTWQMTGVQAETYMAGFYEAGTYITQENRITEGVVYSLMPQLAGKSNAFDLNWAKAKPNGTASFLQLILPTGEGYTVSAIQGYNPQYVDIGKDFAFTVAVDAQHLNWTPAVTVNGVSIVPDSNGVYHLTALASAPVINVTLTAPAPEPAPEPEPTPEPAPEPTPTPEPEPIEDTTTEINDEKSPATSDKNVLPLFLLLIGSIACAVGLKKWKA